MEKTILYTSNPNFVPTNLGQLINFADNNNKYYVCYVNNTSKLYNVEEGAHIVTTKGNNVYILQVTDGIEEHDFAKKTNITGILSIDYPFGNKKVNKPTTSVSSISTRLKDMFMPKKAEDIRISIDGNICVATNSGYVVIDKDNNLTSYPEEMTLDLPVFIISKPKDQLQVGDVIVTNSSYAKVIAINKDKINTIRYTGSGGTIRTIKDAVLNQTMVRVVVSLAGNINGQFNPMLMMAMSDNTDNLLPLLMMNQTGDNLNMNPLMLLALSKDNTDMKDLLMLSALNGNTLLKGNC